MKDIYRIIDVKPIRPELWNDKSSLIDEISHTIKTLVPFTPEEKYLVFKRKIISPIQRSQKPYYKKSVKYTEDDRWLIKTNDERILGPFTKSEMREIINKNELKNTNESINNIDLNNTKESNNNIELKNNINLKDAFVKRDYDKDFVKFVIINEIPDFLESDKLNELFNNDINNKLEMLNIEDSQPVTNRQKVDDNKFKIEERAGFYKCTEFLKYKKVDLKMDLLIKKLFGKNKEMAVNIIGFLTNLKMEDCDRLVELIVLESKNSVIVDSDGFMKAQKKFIKKKTYY